MKESTLLEMKNKIEAMTRVMQQVINEISHLRELGVGTLETLKLMPGYEDAIEKLKNKMEEEVKQKQKVKNNGAIEQDTK
jgi:predicted ribosome quality control (RQC) complex YloA/Tae2 family protein